MSSLTELSQLKDGWRFGSGLAPNKDCLRKTENIVSQLKNQGIESQSHPGGNGEILTAFYAGGVYMEIITEVNGQVSIFGEKDNKLVLRLENI